MMSTPHRHNPSSAAVRSNGRITRYGLEYVLQHTWREFGEVKTERIGPPLPWGQARAWHADLLAGQMREERSYVDAKGMKTVVITDPEYKLVPVRKRQAVQKNCKVR